MKQFFFKKGKFHPPYFWLFLFLSILALILVLKLIFAIIGMFKVEINFPISDTLVLGYLGFVSVWLAFYNGKRKKE